MPYIQRNAEGTIVAIVKEASDDAREFLSPSHPEIITFLCAGSGEQEQFHPLADLEMVRVIEDLVELLISKNVIVLTDLPPAVQQKLLRQQSRRNKFFSGITIDDGPGGPLF